MYDDDLFFDMSDRRKNDVRRFTESIIDNYENRNKPKKTKPEACVPFAEEALNILEADQLNKSTKSKYISFIHNLKSSLLTEALLNLYKKSTPKRFQEDPASNNIMRAIASSYVNENGYNNILSNMKGASLYTSEVYKTIVETSDEVMEDVDQDNPETFKISPEMKDEFFKQLNYSDSEAIEDAINDRVSTAMQDFVAANTEDHQNITDALEKAQENIGDVDSDSNSTDKEKEELKEYYQGKAKRYINEVREAPKNVFHSMVTAMCESVLKNPTENAEFMNEGKLDMDKIVNRTGLMYSFVEMLNTARIHKINESYIQEIIDGLKQ